MVSITPTFHSFRETLQYLKKSRLGPRESVVVLSRHGRTVFNDAGKLQAWTPDEDRLTPFGIKCARALARPISKMPIRWIASSDSTRAVETIQRAVRGGEIKYFRELRDFDYGNLGGLTFEGPDNQFRTLYPKLFDTWKNDRMHFAAPGGENYPDFSRRVSDAFSSIIYPNSLGKVSFVVSHKVWVRELLLRLVLPSDANLAGSKIEIEGTSITVLHFGRDGSPTLLLFNNTDHLERERYRVLRKLGMREIIFPGKTPGYKAGDSPKTNIFPIYDDNGKMIGQALREDAHRDGLLHKTVHLLLFNSKGELLVQRRSLFKDRGRGRLTQSVGGHLTVGDTPEKAVFKEAKEELELEAEAFKCRLLTRYRYESPDTKTGRNRELVYLFIGQYEEEGREAAAIKPNKTELAWAAWFDFEVLSRNILEESELFKDAQRLDLFTSSFPEDLRQYVQNSKF